MQSLPIGPACVVKVEYHATYDCNVSIELSCCCNVSSASTSYAQFASSVHVPRLNAPSCTQACAAAYPSQCGTGYVRV